VKSRSALIAVGLAIVAGLAIYLLVASGRDSSTPSDAAGAGSGSTQASSGDEPGSAGRSSGGDVRRVVRTPSVPSKTPVAAAADAGAVDSIAVPRNPAVKESLPEKLAADAHRRQVATLRVELTSLKERAEKLTKVLARVKAEGSANAVQLQQIQRQLQQSVDAQPRVQAMLEKAEKELREAEEKRKKAEEKKAEEKQPKAEESSP
jgi:hypothetical protein